MSSATEALPSSPAGPALVKIRRYLVDAALAMKEAAPELARILLCGVDYALDDACALLGTRPFLHQLRLHVNQALAALERGNHALASRELASAREVLARL